MFAKQNVYVVFQNDRLMNRDLKQNAKLIDYAKTCGLSWDKYVHYQTTTKISHAQKKGIMILDEADTQIFDDISQYYSNTAYKNIKVIGMTATPFHGSKDGAEAASLDIMNFGIYRNNFKVEDFDPKVNKTVKLGSLTKWTQLIEDLRKQQSVLIYANGEEYKQLVTIDYVMPVHVETNEAMLKKLDNRLGEFYPVYIISSGMGDRGEDFRAPGHSLGIALVILGTFTDARSRIQTLSRVGRYNDACSRIQDETFALVDEAQ